MFENSSAKIVPKFRERYSELEPEIQEKLVSAIEHLLNNYGNSPWNHPDVKRIESMNVWRLKVGERNCETDHRIFFDIEDSEIKFLTLRHRDKAYSSDL